VAADAAAAALSSPKRRVLEASTERRRAEALGVAMLLGSLRNYKISLVVKMHKLIY
jgi:hypothetical protein